MTDVDGRQLVEMWEQRVADCCDRATLPSGALDESHGYILVHELRPLLAVARAQREALERYIEGDSCQCEDCPQCGRDPAECLPECSRTCQCGWCRYCLALVALGASPRDGDVSAHV